MPLRHRSRRAPALAALLLVLAGVTAGAGEGVAQVSSLKVVRRVRLQVVRGRMHVPKREVFATIKTRGTGRWPWSQRPTLRLDFVHADTSNIAVAFRQHGFLDVQVSDTILATRRADEVDVVFRIREGSRSRIATVTFEGVTAIPPAALRKPLYARPGREFNPAYLIADTALISRAYQKKGWLPAIEGGAARDSLDPLRIHVVYMVHEGPRYRMGQSYVTTVGQVKVPDRLIRRELLLAPGRWYDITRVEDSQQRLYDTGLFSQVQISPLPDSLNTTMEFQVQLREHQPRWLDAGVGSGTEERFQFTGEWGHRNLLARGLQGVLEGRYAIDSRYRFLLARGQASLIEPWLFGTRNRFQTTLYIERHDFRSTPDTVVSNPGDEALLQAKNARGVSFQVRHDFALLNYVQLVQDNTFVQQRQQFLKPLPQALEDSLTAIFQPRYATHRLQLSGQRDQRDNPVNPGRGSLQNASADVAGGPFHAATHFSKFQLGSAWYTPTPAHAGWVIASHVRMGLIKPFGEATVVNPVLPGVDPDVSRVPIEDVFRLGGVNSIRGFNENAIPTQNAIPIAGENTKAVQSSGGLVMLLANLELRVPVVGPFGLEAYVDAGNVWTRPGYVTLKDFSFASRSSAADPGGLRVHYVYGIGGRFNLPFGPLRLDYSDAVGESVPQRLQFAIGPAF
ncbi:MAG TPA: BamA/TamA family outer membrane protein [Candidatus Eisenbacteria bacterium]|nr:BamA/TamA family outer membrane protein [Candidatus Eisenbacteria bacterium]